MYLSNQRSPAGSLKVQFRKSTSYSERTLVGLTVASYVVALSHTYCLTIVTSSIDILWLSQESIYKMTEIESKGGSNSPPSDPDSPKTNPSDDDTLDEQTGREQGEEASKFGTQPGTDTRARYPSEFDGNGTPTKTHRVSFSGTDSLLSGAKNSSPDYNDDDMKMPASESRTVQNATPDDKVFYGNPTFTPSFGDIPKVPGVNVVDTTANEAASFFMERVPTRQQVGNVFNHARKAVRRAGGAVAVNVAERRERKQLSGQPNVVLQVPPEEDRAYSSEEIHQTKCLPLDKYHMCRGMEGP